MCKAWCLSWSAAEEVSSTIAAFSWVMRSSWPTAAVTCSMPWLCSVADTLMSLMIATERAVERARDPYSGEHRGIQRYQADGDLAVALIVEIRCAGLLARNSAGYPRRSVLSWQTTFEAV